MNAFLCVFLVKLEFVRKAGTVASAPTLRSASLAPAQDAANPALQNHTAVPEKYQFRQRKEAMTLISILLEERSSLQEVGKVAKMMCMCLFIFLLVGLFWQCCAQESVSVGPSQGPSPPPKSPRKLSEDEALKLLESAWPQAYLEANDEERKALELLLFCGIIQPDEFANGDVSHQHVEECMWIAMQMLRQREYTYWIQNPIQAERTFDESVTSRFPERRVLRSTASTSGMVTPEFVPSYTPSLIGVVDCHSKPMSPESKSPLVPSPPFPQFYKRDIGMMQIKKVQVRCEELATGSAMDLTPRCMIRALQSMPPSRKSSSGGPCGWPEGHSILASQEVMSPRSRTRV